MKLLTSIGLLLLAIVGIMTLGLPTFIIQVVRYIARERLELDDYFYKLAISLDYLGATLIFGTRGRTISALVFKKDIKYTVKFVDIIFYDGRCKEAYIYEINKEKGAK